MSTRMAGRDALAMDIADRVAEAMADEQLRRRRDGRDALSAEEEDRLARDIARLELLRTDESKVAASDGIDDVISSSVAHVLGLGRLQPLLDDDEITDIHVRGNEHVWVKLRDGRRDRRDPVVRTDEELVTLIRRAAARLGRMERRFDAGTPELNMQLPDGSRLFAVMDVSLRPSLVIRRHRFELASLSELRHRGMIDRRLHDFLGSAVRARRNVVIAGGTGSGKTTLLRALINEISPGERIVTIEDAYELGIDRFADRHPDHDALQSRPSNVEGEGEITLADLTRMALRMDPDRVIVGEVRGAEAFPMLMAMSQGNDGSMCTMHADGSKSAFSKLAAYVSMASTGLPIDTVNVLMASAVHFVVHVEHRDGRRMVTSIREVIDSDGASIVSNEIYRTDRAGNWAWPVPLRAATRALLSEYGYADRETGGGS